MSQSPPRSTHMPSSCQLAPNGNVDYLRHQIIDIINEASKLRSNITHEERQAITELKNEDSITITEADKGKAAVIMDTPEFLQLVNNSLSDTATYLNIKKDTTAKKTMKDVHEKNLHDLPRGNSPLHSSVPAPLLIKQAIIATLIRRATALCHHDALSSELDHLRKTLTTLNGYPAQLVTATINKTLKDREPRPKPSPSPIRVTIPYLGPIRHKISRLIKTNAGIDVTFSSGKTITTYLTANDEGRVKTDGKLDIRFIRYWSDGKESSGRCCDNELTDLCINNIDKCDPMFYLLIDGQDGIMSRSLYHSTTHYTKNQNKFKFGRRIQGTPNPFIIQVSKALPSSIKVMVQVYDNDDTSSDDHMDTLSKQINIQAAAIEQIAMYTPYILKRRTKLEIAVRAYCDPDWYGSACERYCKATPDHSHYTCHQHTGAKMCFEGWMGDNCSQDIDECTESGQICQNGGSCTNTHGSFECKCLEGVTGTQCENIINQCELGPCLNGGKCDGNETDFKCACPVEWTGETCADKVNFCDSFPCNMGQCTPDLLTAARFKCDCDFAWVGDRCSQSVDIVNITLLGEINRANRGYLVDGLNKLITELGGIPGKVEVKLTTHTQKECNYTRTYVQLYFAGENGSLVETDSLDRIFESHPDEIINEYLPLPLNHLREYVKTTMKIPHDNWDTNQHVSAILPPVGLVVMTVLFLAAFSIWRRRSNTIERSRDENHLSSLVLDVPCNRRTPGAMTENIQEASVCPDGYTSLRFLEEDEGSLGTLCDGPSNVSQPPEDITLDPDRLQGFGGYPDDNGCLVDVATVGTHVGATSNILLQTEDMALDEVIAHCFGVSPGNARLGDAAALDTNTSNLNLAADDMAHDRDRDRVIVQAFNVSPDVKISLPDMVTPRVTEDLTFDSVILQDPRCSPYEHAHHSDEGTLHDVPLETLNTHCDETLTTETRTLDTVRLRRPRECPDGHVRLGEVGARRHVKTCIQSVTGDMTLIPGSLEAEVEDAEYTVIDDEDGEELLQEDPYETIESADDKDFENISQKDPYETIKSVDDIDVENVSLKDPYEKINL
ncbi:uncharacterized protein [Haliotis asinina]|uniref:uncharacterized protein n=1 Tax=Haliotis asinina TaxID=109174 RepID=UPI003531F56E